MQYNNDYYQQYQKTQENRTHLHILKSFGLDVMLCTSLHCSLGLRSNWPGRLRKGQKNGSQHTAYELHRQQVVTKSCHYWTWTLCVGHGQLVLRSSGSLLRHRPVKRGVRRGWVDAGMAAYSMWEYHSHGLPVRKSLWRWKFWTISSAVWLVWKACLWYLCVLQVFLGREGWPRSYSQPNRLWKKRKQFIQSFICPSYFTEGHISPSTQSDSVWHTHTHTHTHTAKLCFPHETWNSA